MTVIMLTSRSTDLQTCEEGIQEIYLTDHKHSVEEKIPLSKTKGTLPLVVLLKLSLKFYSLSLWERIKVRARAISPPGRGTEGVGL